MNQKTYKATFLLDTRGQEQTVDNIIEVLTKDIQALQGEVQAVNNHGDKEFARTPDKKFVSGTFVEFVFSAPPLQPNALTERTRLNPVVNRVLTQLMD